MNPLTPSVRVTTLGRLRVEVRGKPVPVRDQAHNRSLQLLALLIAMGGQHVPIERLEEGLWPQADGDRAHRAFVTTLHRLRKLLGAEVLVLRDGLLSLSPRHCWVDAFELDGATVPTGLAEPAAAWDALAVALARYRGPFLEFGVDHPAVVATRERLHKDFLRRSEALAAAHERAGRFEAAVAACRRALVEAPASEALTRRIMVALRGAGRLEEAIAAFQRYRAACFAQPGLAPSGEAQALLQDLLDERDALRLQAEQPSLTVCPFASLGSDAGLRWVGAGFTENLTAALTRLPGLTLIGSLPAGDGADSATRARELGRELAVRYVLTGSVQASGERLRVTAQLIETATARHLWAERYDRALSDALAVQDEIIDRIVVAMQVQLTEGEQARSVWRETTDDLQAWELAIRGLASFRLRTRAGHEEARRLWTAALQRDPSYVMALVPLGWIYIGMARYGWCDDPAAAARLAEDYAERALERSPRSGPAHGLMAHSHILQRRYGGVEALLRRAAELNASGADTAVIVGAGLSFIGQPREALEWVRKAMRLAPCYPEWYLAVLARAHYFCGDYAQAVQAAQQSRISRQMLGGRVLTAAGHAALGELEAARECVRDLLLDLPAFTRATHLPWLFPMQRTADSDRLEADLRAAGCP